VGPDHPQLGPEPPRGRLESLHYYYYYYYYYYSRAGLPPSLTDQDRGYDVYSPNLLEDVSLELAVEVFSEVRNR
jgi:hypothetical protein